MEFHEKYSALDKAYLDETKAKHLAFQLAEHQEFEQKNRIELLNKQNKLLMVEQQYAKTDAINNRLFIALLSAIIALLTFFGYRSWLTQKRLKELAEYDALTGIFNRGHFTQVAKSALRYCQVTGQELSFIMFDLDYFKAINDNYGHARGDWALKQTVEVCQANGRKNDVFARLGGEEFGMLLPGCDLTAAMMLAEQCRAAIAAIDSTESGARFTISASFGVTNTGLSGYSLEKLLNDADSATYQSKHNGRNQVTAFAKSEH